MFDQSLVIEKSLPAIAIRGIVPIPNNDIRLEVGREISVNALLEAEKYDNHVLLLVQQNPLIESPSPKDLYEIGVVAKVIMKVKLPNGNYKVKFKTIMRAKVLSFEFSNPYFGVVIKTLPAVVENVDEELALVRLIVNEVIDGAEGLFINSKEVLNAIQGGLSSDKLADVLAYNLSITEDKKYKYLSTLSQNARLSMILEDIDREKYMKNLEREINTKVKQKVDESQKEYYLREKMRVIQDELGDKARKESEIDQLRDKITKAKMPSYMEEKALDELKRYEALPQSATESGIIKTYLDFIIALPWSKKSKDESDINKAQAKLEEEHYGLEKVKERILEYLAVKIMTKKNPATILCLVGPPGVGKTSLAKSIANALNRKFVKQSLGGVKDEAEIRGHRRTYIGALPGRILQGMKKAGVTNPVFLLDEVDKMSSDYKGDPASAMLEVLDPEQNKYFSDHYLEEVYDLSKVLFIATANYLYHIPAPLRDRMEIVELSSYTEFEKFNIAVKHLIPRQFNAHGMDKDKIAITDGAIWKMIREYTRESGVRQLERLLGALNRKAIKKILSDKIKKVEINEDNLQEFLGKRLFTHNIADKEDQIGVVTGLAYTQFGGDTLSVEATYYKGKGNLVLTGQLGDVMKESAQAALSFVKANAAKYDIDPEIFKENDIHIHVPEGATPKDGPSAGVTMATSIISVLSGKYVNKEVGMTGEITLRGRVLPIGGLREKSIAANRSGLKKIIIPSRNKKDIEDIPESVQEALEIITASCIDDVIKHALK